MYKREVTRYSRKIDANDKPVDGINYMDKVELVDFNYKDLSKDIKKKALKNAMKYYRHTIKEMLDNLYFDEKGNVLGTKGTIETII